MRLTDCTSDASSDSGMIQLAAKRRTMTSTSCSRSSAPGGDGGHGVERVPEPQHELRPQGRQVVQQVAHDETGLGLEEGRHGWERMKSNA